MMRVMTINEKYAYYELAVQSPSWHAEWFHILYKEIRKKNPHVLREDFCGTFQTSCEWAKLGHKNKTYSIDLDPVPLKYGIENNLIKLNPEQQKRIHILKQNVLKKTPKVDIISACNFSFYIFKTRETLIQYFKAAHQSLKRDGIFALEMSGGPGFFEKLKESTRYKKNNKHLFTYIWDQKYYNPINHNGRFAIHFKLPNGKTEKNLFTYDWRVWSIPEVRECLIDAGFKSTLVYWEDVDNERSSADYIRTEEGDNIETLGAFVVGLK